MTKIPTFQLAWLVNRMHVGTSRTSIVRNLRNRMTSPDWNKARRKEAYRYAFSVHDENRKLYRRVTAGI